MAMGQHKNKAAVFAEASRSASRLAMCYMSQQDEKSMQQATELSVSLAALGHKIIRRPLATAAGTMMGATNNGKKAMSYFEQARSINQRNKKYNVHDSIIRGTRFVRYW